MNRAVLFAAAAVAALSLSACEKKATEASGPETAATAPAVEAPAAAVPAAATEAVNAAEDATAGAVGAVSAATTAATNSTEALITGLTTGDIYQVQAGKIAETKGQTPAVKAYGKKMVADHTALTNQMKHVFEATKQKIPTELDARHKGLIANLEAASPADFDKVYLSQQKASQEEELTMLKGYADAGESADLKPAAAKRIPTVQAHLDKVKELQAAAK